jgi:hypothetical protein
MLQRVLSKRDLAGALKAGGGGGGDGKASSSTSSKKSSAFSRDELRELFSLDVRTRCGTREIMLKKDRVNYGVYNKKRDGSGGDSAGDNDSGKKGNEEEEEEDAATKKWRQTAAACAPGDAEAGAPQISAGDGLGMADGRTQLLAAVLATGCVSWVHEEDGKAEVLGEEAEEKGVEIKEDEEEEEEEEQQEEEEVLPDVAAAPASDDAFPVPAAAAPAGRTSIDDESLLEVME